MFAGIDYHRNDDRPRYYPSHDRDPEQPAHDRKRLVAAVVLLACVLGMTLLALAAVAVNCLQAAEGK